MLFLLLLAALARPAWADALPVFSPTGPDAAAYGAAEGYPVRAIGPQRLQRYLVTVVCMAPPWTLPRIGDTDCFEDVLLTRPKLDGRQ
jgi:hypothetical protein